MAIEKTDPFQNKRSINFGLFKVRGTLKKGAKRSQPHGREHSEGKDNSASLVEPTI